MHPDTIFEHHSSARKAAERISVIVNDLYSDFLALEHALGQLSCASEKHADKFKSLSRRWRDMSTALKEKSLGGTVIETKRLLEDAWQTEFRD